MKTKAISAKNKLGSDWLHVLQMHDADRIEILRNSDKDGTLIPFDYMLTEIEYTGAANRFSKGEKISLLPGNPEYQPVISLSNNAIITAHAFTGGFEVEQILKVQKSSIVPPIVHTPEPKTQTETKSISLVPKKSLAVNLIQYAGIAAMLTGVVFIFTALK